MDRFNQFVLFARSLRNVSARRRLIVDRARRAAKSPTEVNAIEVPGLPLPIWLRAGGDDYYTFLQIFDSMQYESNVIAAPALIVDAGANIGLSAVYFANKYPKARILSIEPNEENFRLLKRNTAGYPQVECLHGAVWPVESTIGICNDTEDQNPAGYQVGEISPGTATAVPCFTPLALLNLVGAESIDLLKIDIEGSELELFSQGSDAWLNHVRSIFIELHDAIRPGCGQAFFRAICGRNFEYYQHFETSILRFADN